MNRTTNSTKFQNSRFIFVLQSPRSVAKVVILGMMSSFHTTTNEAVQRSSYMITTKFGSHVDADVCHREVRGYLQVAIRAGSAGTKGYRHVLGKYARTFD